MYLIKIYILLNARFIFKLTIYMSNGYFYLRNFYPIILLIRFLFVKCLHHKIGSVWSLNFAFQQKMEWNIMLKFEFLKSLTPTKKYLRRTSNTNNLIIYYLYKRGLYSIFFDLSTFDLRKNFTLPKMKE